MSDTWGRAIIVGSPVDAVSAEEAVDLILDWTDRDATRVAVGVNAHVCNLIFDDPEFAHHIRSADLCYADGQSIVTASRILRRGVPERIATTDLVYPLAARCAERGKKVFLFGGAPGVADSAAAVLRLSAPGLQVMARDGYDNARDDERLVAEIREFETDIIFVGLGDPLQQRWIAEHRDQLPGVVLLSCGGLFDWTSGSHRRAPAMMIRLGMEWLWRLMIEPRRLGRRYLLGNPLFIMRFIGQVLEEVKSTPARSSRTHPAASSIDIAMVRAGSEAMATDSAGRNTAT